MMSKNRDWRGLAWVVAASGLVAWACAGSDERDALRVGPGDSESSGGHAGSGADTSQIDASVGAGTAGLAGTPSEVAGASGHCSVARATPLPARLVVSTGIVDAPKQRPVFVQDLFDAFKGQCGACHVDATSGGLHVTQLTFVDTISQRVIERIYASNEKNMMPPKAAGGVLASARQPGDPVLQLAETIKAWIDAGRPADVFYVANTEQTDPQQQGGYRMTSAVAEAMTSLGNCIPDRSIYAVEEGAMQEMDTKFSRMARHPAGSATMFERIGLPEHLSDTDLFTLESASLARRGVVAFAPAYPLWTDDAGKLRHVRLPLGTSIKYVAETGQFSIPGNARFYKTFMRETVEADGKRRFRKVETRVIVTRSDATVVAGSHEPPALYGTYLWNDDETDAVLSAEPLRNGTPFRDRLLTLVIDEVVAGKVSAQNPANLSYALEDAKAIRHYAVPGSDRCIDCHMGSTNRSFVLGFLPVQLNRRPTGQGGIIESTGVDELSQLSRLIDLGVIEGLSPSGSDAPTLEHSQGMRMPRNQQELTAQGYILGNCAHCHNPRGFPSVENPVLKDNLDFMPSATGGIFQFPLERTSPRIFRGAGLNVPIPYVTPSLVDFPVEGTSSKPKADVRGDWGREIDPPDPSKTGLPEAVGVPLGIVFAPWRSLIYRNVDTPFSYSDDFALYPHMPMDSPGNDCRAHQILGDWMVSIPAIRKRPNVWEFASPKDGTCIAGGATNCDDESQPYVEAKPGDSDYAAARQAAEERLTMFHSGVPNWFTPWAGPVFSRYGFCPDNSDIVDPSVARGGGNACNPKIVPDTLPIYEKSSGNLVMSMPNIGVPVRSHFVVTDLSDTPGDYNPRRSDWHKVLVEQSFDKIAGADCSLLQSRQDREKEVVADLQSVTVTQALRDYATTDLPFGLWKANPQCHLNSAPSVASFDGPKRPLWMARTTQPLSGEERVYTQSPGEAVFKMICINCHGERADSRGRMAENLMTMTGGTVRVANLRDGLLGPVGSAGANYRQVFGQSATELGIMPEDLAVRYVSWMGLGGTKAQIPPSILSIVGNTQVMGVPRRANTFASVTVTSANMLSTAQELCKNVLPWQAGRSAVDFYPISGSFRFNNSALIETNADAEMWQTLCSLDNQPPIRAVTAADWSEPSVRFRISLSGGFYRANAYPANVPVGDERGKVQPTLDAQNLLPWCIVRPSDNKLAALADAYVAANANNGAPLPFCPASLLVSTNLLRQDASEQTSDRDLSRWASRGAMNAGTAVFLYLQRVVNEGLAPKPSFDRCDLLPQ